MACACQAAQILLPLFSAERLCVRREVDAGIGIVQPRPGLINNYVTTSMLCSQFQRYALPFLGRSSLPRIASLAITQPLHIRTRLYAF
jgi:hypothetical protein